MASCEPGRRAGRPQAPWGLCVGRLVQQVNSERYRGAGGQLADQAASLAVHAHEVWAGELPTGGRGAAQLLLPVQSTGSFNRM